MKYIYLLFLLASFTLTAASQEDPYNDIVYILLDNGMQVYLLSDEKAVNTKIELSPCPR